MKKKISFFTLLTAIILSLSLFCGCSLFGEKVTSETYECTAVSVTNNPDWTENENYTYKSMMEGEIGKIITFNNDGTLESNFKYITAKTWVQEGSTITVGVNQKITVSGNKLILVFSTAKFEFTKQ